MMAVVMTDDELLAALAPLSLRATLDAPDLASSHGRGATDPEDVADLVDHIERGLFASPFSPPTDVARARRREVAASIAFQAVVAQVANPVLLAHRRLGVGLDVGLADLRWRADGWAVRYGLTELRRTDPAPTDEVVASLQAEVVDPWCAAVAAVVALPPRLLRGNTDAALATALVAIGESPPGPSVRDTCCLIHLAGLVPCAECPLT